MYVATVAEYVIALETRVSFHAYNHDELIVGVLKPMGRSLNYKNFEFKRSKD